jgi:hypothetical protein
MNSIFFNKNLATYNKRMEFSPSRIVLETFSLYQNGIPEYSWKPWPPQALIRLEQPSIAQVV